MSVWLAPWMVVKHHGTYIYSGSIPAMAGVINERIKRNDPVPATVRMDASSNKQQQAPPLTVKAFYETSATKRKSLIEGIAESVATQVGVEKDALIEKSKDFIKEWVRMVPDNSLADMLTLLAKDMKG